MSIITISRGSHTRGKEIAEKVANKLGYKCIAREVLIDASASYNISEVKLLQAIADPPSFFDRFTRVKEKYITYIESELLKHLKQDNIVYHGFAGHFFVKDISHVLKVRIIADIKDRAKIVMERDKISKKEAFQFLKKIDSQRTKWSKNLYGIDVVDPVLYDIVINIKNITVDRAVEIICKAVKLKQFQTTPESQKAIEDLSLASQVKAALTDANNETEVYADGGDIRVKTVSTLSEKEKDKIKKAAEKVSGVLKVTVQKKV
ncbi:MAG: cytidylate kinase-like family protein [Syntrophales bacterium]|nr:cytidylate kinase-like family protein [Syntrophales bacterium]